jgi:hypothetical protein
MGLMWAGMERNIAMMIASVPALRPLAGPVANLTSQTMSYLGVRSSKTQQTYEMNNSGNSYENKSQGSSHPGKKSFSTAAADRSTSLERILPEMAPRDIV